MRKRILVVVLAITAVLVLTAGTAAAQNGTVSAEAQTTEGGSVVIDSIEMEEDGAVAVYDEDSISEEPNSLLGYAEVSEGTSSDVEVELDESMEEHGFLHAVLYTAEPPSTFDDEDDSVVTEESGEVAQDFFFVSVASEDLIAGAEALEDYDADDLMDNLDSYAQINQQRRENSESISNLERQIDELEQRGGEDFEDEIQDLRDQISDIEGNNDGIESEISRLESNLNDLEDIGAEAGNETDTDGNGTEDGTEDGNVTDDGEDDGDDGSDEPEGLPGFTVVAALVALLTGGALLRRNDE
ncbi:MAG: PGF-CTERM sorting domain-containing protein [Halobacteriales archaeon]|nr:PGF-CTERM sorting domain-containing protein [Halobacteriales archaeon]